ncbi:maleylpyruvate isomerase N-terminal domain-containing protein [Streptomyces sp. TRM66268-LWL]|uniref:Maleylpyruvate isomerase N-terminal domain-containing protein n=1 Tax=Streptomyces polyasparticus TaxID=2767826 RepID=A0ABR7SE88_9ACTN|nr:maleylpyruvate isomerase family mycothiol-dependent enzyme [Streptomyces polyasparticus]MBC9713733.1 maleylpyruvate isomerase N-terminal domain-containing protein [Streptomyces polyasparticus]
MTRSVHELYAARITDQTRQLAAAVEGSDAATPVPGLGGGTLAHLLRHVGGAHRWAETVIRTRATAPVSDDQVNDVTPGEDDELAGLSTWLLDGAEQFAATLLDTPEDTPVWTVAPSGRPAFWARRMTYETVVHRHDATAAVGGTYRVDAATAADGIEEWLGFSTLPQAYASPQAQQRLIARDRTLHLHGTDAADGQGEWLIDLGGSPMRWSHGHHKATTAVRGPLKDLLLALYERRAPDAALEVFGEEGLFTDWVHAAGDWLRR